MSSKVTLNKFFPIDVDSLYKYFVDSELLEKWAYPDGMSLKVPLFEARVDGKYRFEHTGQDGLYLCTGRIKELVPGIRLVQFDESVKGPKGETLHENLECTIEFSPQFGGAEVSLIQSGFKSNEAANECRVAWGQSFDKLTRIVSHVGYDKRGNSEIPLQT